MADNENLNFDKAKQAQKEAQAEAIKIEGQLNRAQRKMDALYGSLVGANTEQLKILRKQLQKQAVKIKVLKNEKEILDELNKKRKEETEELQRQEDVLKRRSETFRDIAKTLSNIPGIGGLLSDVFEKAAEVTEKTGSRMKGLLSIVKSIAEVAGPAALVKSLLDVSNQTQDISRNLGVGFESAREIRKEFSQIAADSNDVRINSIDLVKAQGELITSFGLNVQASGEVSKNFIRNSEYLGASVEAAGKLEKIIAVTGTSSSEFSNSLALAANETSQLYGINLPLKDVVEGISKFQGATLGYLMESPKALTEAVALTKQLGVEFSEIRNTANSLLEFQSSITNEVNAEVLLGRDINLNRARALAFMGDEVGLAKEITQQIGSLAEYNDMLPIQQEAFAQTLGMSRDRMAEILMQNELSTRFGAQARDLSLEQLQAAKDIAEAKGLTDGEALRIVQEEVSATKRFEDAAQKIRAAFQDAVVSFAPIIEKVADVAGNFAKSPYAKMLTIGAALLGSGFAVFKGLQGLTPATAMWTRPVGAPGTGGGMMMGGGALYNKGTFYKGGQFLPGGGRAPAGGTTVGGGLTGMGAGMLGLAGMIGGQAILASTDETSIAGNMFGKGLSMAGTGAMMGSMFGLPGAGVGAAIGLVYGSFTGYLDAKEAEREAKREEYENRRAEMDPIAKEIKLMRQALDGRETSIEMDGHMLGKLQENRPYNGMSKPVLS